MVILNTKKRSKKNKISLFYFFVLSTTQFRCGGVKEFVKTEHLNTVEQNLQSDNELVIYFNGKEHLERLDFDNLRYFRVNVLNSPYSLETKMYGVKDIFFSYNSICFKTQGNQFSRGQIRDVFEYQPNELIIDSLSVMDNNGYIQIITLNTHITIDYPLNDDFYCLDIYDEVNMKNLIKSTNSRILNIEVSNNQKCAALDFAKFATEYTVLVKSKNETFIWIKSLYYDTKTIDNICIVDDKNNIDTLTVEISGDYIWTGKIIFTED